MIPLAEPNLTGREADYLLECVRTNFVSTAGPYVAQFEEAFAGFVGSPFAVATANGTCAIHIALILAGVGPGDEVWVSDFTFIASANPIRYLGARPVLVDSEARTWNLDPALVTEELDRRARLGQAMPKAVIAVHILGCPVDLAPIAGACARHGVCLIEDAAEALGASYTDGPFAGRRVGTVGTFGCYSFNGNKIMTTGGGGMVVTADPALARRGRHLTTQAKLPGCAYDHDEVGFNYRLTNLQAALGLAQLERLPAFIAAKRRLAAAYASSLGDIPGLELPPEPAGMAPTWWLFSVLLHGGWERPQRELEAMGIHTRPLWTPLHRMAPYRDAPILGSGAVAARIASQGLSLPCSVHLTARDQETVMAALRALAEGPR